MAIKWDNVAILQQDAPDAVQVNPCTMRVTVGETSKNLVYPYPIDGTRSKTRIARKSRWIEVNGHIFPDDLLQLNLSQVIAPLSEPFGSGGFSIARFPMLISKNGSPTIWNIHSVRLDSLPIMSQDATKSEGVQTHILLSLSDREHQLKKAGTVPLGGPLSEMKDSILRIFRALSQTNRPQVFGLQAPKARVYTIIFFNKFRLDLASNTMVADCVVLDPSPEVQDLYSEGVTNKTLDDNMRVFSTSSAETLLWKHFLPVLTERCRTWSHRPTCNYRRAGKVRISTEIRRTLRCGCGSGHDLGSFDEVPAWKGFAPYATRAAISPLFAVSYMEEVAGMLKDIGKVASSEVALASEEASGPQLCAQCGVGAVGGERLLLCSRCKDVRYCGKVCQDAHWKKHKKRCQAKK